MEYSRKNALQRHKRNRHGTTQPYPQSSDAYPPSSQAYPPPPPPLLTPSPLTPPLIPPPPPLTPPILRGGLPIYILKDFHDEEIKGTFRVAESQYTGR